jgi:hypothetical protein
LNWVLQPVLELVLISFCLVGEGLNAASAPAPIKGHSTNLLCSRLLVSANPVFASSLPSDTPTEKYIQYLAHFVRQGELDLNDLKILRGFSKLPNFIDVFGSKISEGDVYRESIHELLPFVNVKRFHEFLDELIKENTKDLILVEKALHETEEVPVTFGLAEPALKATSTFNDPLQIQYTDKNFTALVAVRSVSQEYILKIDNSRLGPFLLNKKINVSENLRTGEKKDFEGVAVAAPFDDAKWGRLTNHWINSKGQLYVMRYSQSQDLVMVHNASTGKKIFQSGVNNLDFKEAKESQFFRDKKETYLATFSLAAGGDHFIFISKNGGLRTQAIKLPDTRGFQWAPTYKDELYGGFTYKKDGKRFLLFLDVSKFEKSGALRDIEIRDDEELVGLTENNKGGFTALLTKNIYPGISLRTIDFQYNKTTRRWADHAVTYNLISPAEEEPIAYTNSDAIILRDAMGRLSFFVFVKSVDTVKSFLFKHGEKKPKESGPISSLLAPVVLTKSDGSQMLVTMSWGERDFFKFDVSEGRVRKMPGSGLEPVLKGRSFVGAGLSGKDEALLYFAPKNSAPSLETLIPIRLNGTFKPGDVK